jgi:hypothetical protein
VYARLVRGVNAQRDFKHLSAEKVLTVRDAHPAESARQLAEVEQASGSEGAGVDGITLNFALRTRAKAEAREGDLAKAGKTLEGMVRLFQRRKVNPHVLQTIKQQAQDTESKLVAEAGGEGPAARDTDPR